MISPRSHVEDWVQRYWKVLTSFLFPSLSSSLPLSLPPSSLFSKLTYFPSSSLYPSLPSFLPFSSLLFHLAFCLSLYVHLCLVHTCVSEHRCRFSWVSSWSWHLVPSLIALCFVDEARSLTEFRGHRFSHSSYLVCPGDFCLCLPP